MLMKQNKTKGNFVIDLRDVVSTAYSNKVADKVRPLISRSDFRSLFGNRIADEVVRRTRDDNKSWKGKSLGKYSKEYKKSLVFQVYKDGDPVNLTLTGDMLDTLNSRNDGRYAVMIQVAERNKGKALGHITGQYGKKGRAFSGDRDFLGMNDKDIVKIFKETVKDYNSESLLVAAELGA